MNRCLLAGVIRPFTFKVVVNLLGFKSDMPVPRVLFVLTIFPFSISFFCALLEQCLDFYFDLLTVVF